MKSPTTEQKAIADDPFKVSCLLSSSKICCLYHLMSSFILRLIIKHVLCYLSPQDDPNFIPSEDMGIEEQLKLGYADQSSDTNPFRATTEATWEERHWGGQQSSKDASNKLWHRS